MRKMGNTILAAGLLLALALPVNAGQEMNGTLDADRVTVRNLIGEIEVRGHSNSTFEIEVQVLGENAAPDAVRLETREGSRAEWSLVFPKGERRFVYPELGDGETRFSPDKSSWLADLFGSIAGGITVSGKGSGMELWADVIVHVPRGKSIEIEHGVGRIHASDLEGEIVLASRSGRIDVSGAEGELSVDTGSGRVVIENVSGEITADTGSGRVAVRHCHGERLSVDTGSGRVELEDVDVARLMVDTGSGSVDAEGVGADHATIGTGSGRVALQLARMGDGDFEIDTGSGSIQLSLPMDASADLEADTGSGGIRFDLAGDYDIKYQEKDEAAVRIGGGAATVKLDTGSGGIKITQGG